MVTSTREAPVTKRRIYLLCGWSAWLIYVSNIPSVLHYPWNVLGMLLGILSPYLCYKALITRTTSEHECRDELGNALSQQSRIAMKYWTYLIPGIVAWGIFVSSIPPFPLDPRHVLRGFLGIVSALLWLAALILFDKIQHGHGDASRDKLNRIAWTLFIFAMGAWTFFVVHVPSNLYHPWYVLHLLLGCASPYLLFEALWLTKHSKSKHACGPGSKDVPTAKGSGC